MQIVEKIEEKWFGGFGWVSIELFISLIYTCHQVG